MLFSCAGIDPTGKASRIAAEAHAALVAGEAAIFYAAAVRMLREEIAVEVDPKAQLKLQQELVVFETGCRGDHRVRERL